MMALLKTHHNFFTCREHVRKWAVKNALTLVFMSIMFVITWVVIILSNVLTGGSPW